MSLIAMFSSQSVSSSWLLVASACLRACLLDQQQAGVPINRPARARRDRIEQAACSTFLRRINDTHMIDRAHVKQSMLPMPFGSEMEKVQ